MSPTDCSALKTVRVLVVDDAPLMRKAISRILNDREDIFVVGTAANGLECLKMVEELRPDVVTLDIDMPVMNGLTALKNIMVRHQVPTVIVSSMVEDGYFAFEALRLGVMDFVPKPTSAAGTNWESQEELLCRRIRMASGMRINRMRRVRKRYPPAAKGPSVPPELRAQLAPSSLVVMGTTLAGPNSIMHALSELSSGCAGAVVALQEIHPKILAPFCEHFNAVSPIEIVPVIATRPLVSGKVYMCSTFSEVLITPSPSDKSGFVLSAGKESQNPIDRLFQSAASTFGSRVCAVILTGIGRDGALGMKDVRDAGGRTLAQEQDCCVYPNLVENAVRAGSVETILPLDRIPSELRAWMSA